MKTKIEHLCNVKKECVISANDSSIIYDVPFGYIEQNLDQLILKKLGLPVHKIINEKINKWRHVVKYL